MDEKIKEKVTKQIKKFGKMIIVSTSSFVLLVSLFFGVINGVFSSASKIFSDIIDNIKIDGNNIVVDENYMKEAEEKLEKLGINSKTLGLGNENYLERYLEAEIVTSYPYLGGEGLQGAVYFERAKIDGTTVRLSYLEYNDFYNRFNSGGDVDNYFTVDQNDWTVHVKKIDGNIEKINYKNMVEKFAMPFEFPIALALTSQNPQFALAVVNLVEDSRIIITIAESATTTTTTVTEHYHETIEENIPGDENTEAQTNLVSEGDKQGEPQITTTTTYSTNIFLSSARTWILNEITDLKYDNSSEDLEPVEAMMNPVMTYDIENKEDGTSIRTTRSNRKTITETHYDYQRWLRGTSKVIEKSDRFTKLILNDGATNGNGFVQIAKELHDYLVEYQYYYSSRPNVSAGRFVQDGEAISSRRPTIGEPMSERYLCCTTFTAWVLDTAGYEGIDFRSLDLLDNSIKDRGWELIEDIEDVEPGDMCFWYGKGTTELKHTNVCAAKEPDGTLRYYDTGCTDSIRTLDPILYVDNMGGIRTFAYAYRPNDEIAKALGANSIEELKQDIEDFIDISVTEGKYSVKVVNLDNNSEDITISNKRVKSNGLIKLFIMATAYNEVRNGKLKEEDIVADLERMITTDSNTSANALLTTMGNGDIRKGIDKVNEYTRGNSYTETKLAVELEQDTLTDGHDDTYTSVKDVATILRKMYDGTCVNSTYSEKMINILKGQLNEDMIPSTITEAEIASKNGEQNGIIQDSAIIATENSNYLLVISASDITNTENAKENIRQIANIVNLYFEKHPTTKENENYKKDDEIETRMNGNRVCYRLTSGQFQCPLDNLVEGSEMLFELLGKYEKTQSHERLMRYLLYLLTGNDYGVTEFDFNEFLNGSFYGVTGLVGSTPEEKVWWALRDAGYSKEAAAGAMGNIYAESGFSASVIEGGSGIGFGLCQWSFGRRTQLESYAKSKGVSASDVDTQIEFLLGELTPGGGANGYASYQLVSYNGYSASSWRNASTPEEAAIAFCWSFERPGIPRMDVRTSAARRYYEQFKDAQRPAGGANGSLLQAADNVARYLIDNNYTYLGTGSANYTFPIANSGLRTLSCSSYVQECLLQAGYSGAAGGEKLWARGENVSAAISDFRNMGINVQLIEDMSALQPGDIIQFRSPWPGGYHVAIVYNVSGGNVQYKGVAEVMNPAVGNNRSNGAVGFDGRTKPFSYYQTYRCYALRITN